MSAVLERKVRELEQQLRRLGGKTPQEEAAEAEAEQEAHFDRVSKRELERELGRHSPIREQFEQRRRRAQAWLDAAGVPQDADDALKLLILSLPNEPTQRMFAKLTLDISGDVLDVGEPWMRQVVAAWPKISTAVQSSLAIVAQQYTRLLGVSPLG